jgi:hypothetical protein
MVLQIPPLLTAVTDDAPGDAEPYRTAEDHQEGRFEHHQRADARGWITQRLQHAELARTLGKVLQQAAARDQDHGGEHHDEDHFGDQRDIADALEVVAK